MDKQELYEKAEKAINQAFETAKKSAKTMSEKAGEAALVTRLMIEKATLEHRVSRKFAELGGKVYAKALREGKTLSLAEAEVKQLIQDTQKLDIELSQVEAALVEERRGRRKVQTGKA